MVWSVFNYYFDDSKVAKEGKRCSRLLAVQKVAKKAKVAQKLPSTICLCLI